MAKYRVLIEAVVSKTVEIDAVDEAEAEELAIKNAPAYLFDSEGQEVDLAEWELQEDTIAAEIPS